MVRLRGLRFQIKNLDLMFHFILSALIQKNNYAITQIWHDFGCIENDWHVKL